VTYDDGGRKMHRVTTGAGGVTSDVEFDAAGMGIKVTSQTTIGKMVSTMTVTATQKICK
jgi:hypothetical protein